VFIAAGLYGNSYLSPLIISNAQAVEPHLSPEQLAEEILCRFTGLKHGLSLEEAAGLRSTAALQISCYLVPVALLMGTEQTQILNDEETKTKMNGKCTWDPYCFPYPESAVSQGYEAIASDLSDDDALEARKQASFRAKLTWDVWDECDPEKEAFLMPVHEITEFANRTYFDDDKERVIHGLLLYRAEENDLCINRFRRRGYFTLSSNETKTKFWRAAIRREPILGIELGAKPGVAVPLISAGSREESRYDVMTRQDGILQYCIELI
jgi:hypothetical protein